MATTQTSYAVTEAWICPVIFHESMAKYFLGLCASATRPNSTLTFLFDLKWKHLTETVVRLDVPEHGLRFDETVAAVHHSSVAGEQFPCALLEGIKPVVGLRGPAVRLNRSICIAETAPSNGELYTIVTNRASRRGKGTISPS